MFGNEIPFHLRPLPFRGERFREVEQRQHYTGYVHPLLNFDSSAGYMTDKHRLHPLLTVNDELGHERDVRDARVERKLQKMRQCQQERLRRLNVSREEEFSKDQARAARRVGTAVTNMDSEGRDVITHRCYQDDAQRQKDYNDALARHKYFSRQRVRESRFNSTPFNIITWESRRPVAVPPLPDLLPQTAKKDDKGDK